VKRQGLGIRGWGLGAGDSGFGLPAQAGVRVSGLAILLGLGFFPIFCSPGLAAELTLTATEPRLKITVLVSDYAQVPRGILARGMKEAARIFREVGIKTSWVNCTAPAPATQMDPACHQPLRPTYLVLRIHPRFQNANGVLRDTTLGFSLLAAERGRSAHASVFYDYVEDLAHSGEASRDQILGHAIAHEFGHLLLETMGHSLTGLMRAQWDREDLGRIYRELLPFTPEQAEMIRADVQARMRLQEATLVPSVAFQK